MTNLEAPTGPDVKDTEMLLAKIRALEVELEKMTLLEQQLQEAERVHGEIREVVEGLRLENAELKKEKQKLPERKSEREVHRNGEVVAPATPLPETAKSAMTHEEKLARIAELKKKLGRS